MIQKWETVADMLLVDLPGCEWPMARIKLIESAEEFFEKTGAWRVLSDPINLQRGLNEYDVLPLTNVELVAVIHVKAGFGRRPLDPRNPAEFLESNDQHEIAEPRIYAWIGGRLHVAPTPALDGEPLQVMLAVKPTITAVGLPQDLWAQYRRYLLAGARWKLKSSPLKPYTDQVGAVEQHGIVEDGIATTILALSRSRTNASQRVRPNYL